MDSEYIYQSSYYGKDIDDAVSKKHSHNNLDILSKITAPYTSEQKNKLDKLSTTAQHEHLNKTILDNITKPPASISDAIPRISWEAMDTFDGEAAVVVRSTDVQTSPSEGTHTDYRNLLIQSRHYPTYNGEHDNNDFKTQLLYCEDGSIKKREFDLYEWTEWAAIASNSHTHANKAILDAITDAPISDAPSDSSVYGRKNGAWSKMLQSLPEVAYADLDDFCPVNDDDGNFGTYTGIYKVYKTDDGSEDYSWGQIPHRNRDAYVLAVSEYSYDNNVTCTQTLYGANALPRQRVKQIASGSTKSENEWTDWSAVTYTKYEINQLINPTVKNTLTSPITANTIYNLGKQTALTITLPSASVGKFVQFDFVSGSAATTLTVNSSSGLTDFDLIPAANTVYSLYFDWGAIGYSGTSVTYGWRFSYSEYPIASV